MLKKAALVLLAIMATAIVEAQEPVLPRANVVAYYDDAAIEKGAYRESPYYEALQGGWQPRATDSSVCYTRELDVEREWKEFHVYLNVRGGRAVRVLVNDQEVGYGDDSRHWNEFLLDPVLKYGRTNSITIETMKQAKGGLLEDAAMQVGLNGTPFILFKNDPNVEDFSLVADYDAATGTGSLSVAADVFCGKRKGKYYLEVEIWDAKGHIFDRMGRWVVFNGRNEELVEMERSWQGVKAWNAETPTLYTALLRLRDEKMEEEELLGTRFGFRRVEVKDGQLLVNGRPIVVKGVTYGLEHTDGDAAREKMKNDVETMKRLNINAVRTLRYSPVDPYFYELCDLYGLYVVCDANLMPLSEQHLAVATDQEYLPLFEKRVENMYEKYKNHTSIIAWSLGNTRDNGVCMTAAYKRLKAIDKNRPVIFSGADHGEATDIIAPMYADEKTLKQTLGQQGTRPFLMLASVDSKHFADMEPLWRIVGQYRQLQGGFVDVWPLTPVMQHELKHLYGPFGVSVSKISPDEGEFVVYNYQDFTGFGQYSLDYNVFTNLRPSITGGELPVAIAAKGSDKVNMRIPRVDLRPGEELYIRFSLNTRRISRQSWQRNEDLMRDAVELPLNQVRKSLPMKESLEGPVPDTLGESEIIHQELRFIGHEDWSAERVGRQVRKQDNHTVCVDYMYRYRASDGSPMCDVRSTYTQFGSGDVMVDYTFAPTDRISEKQLHPAIIVRQVGDSIVWFGLDHEVCFENNMSGLVGIYGGRMSKGKTYRQMRWCALYGDNEPLLIEPMGMRCTMTTKENSVWIVPQENNKLRLHLRRFKTGEATDYVGYDYPRTAQGILQPPTINSSEVRFSAPLSISISTSQSCEVRYTLDGSEPTEVSKLYTAPFEITATTVVKARAFAKEMPPSFTATRRFNYDHIVKTTFSRKANTPYNAGMDTILFDGEKGEVEDFSRGWLGFSGGELQMVIQLAKPIDVETVTLRFAHNPAFWAFAPQTCKVSVSSDGTTYGAPVPLDMPFDPEQQANEEARILELEVPLKASQVGFIRVDMTPIVKIPAWHRGKGLKPWLMMDEVQVEEMIGKE